MNKFFGWLNNYNNFSKGDRNTILILSIFILLLFIGIIVVDNIQPKSKYDYEQYQLMLNALEAPKTESTQKRESLFIFDPNTITAEMMDSLDLPGFVKRNIISYRKAGGRFSSSADMKKIYGMNDSIFYVIESFISIGNKANLNKNKTKEEVQIIGFIDPNRADFNQLVDFGFNTFQSNNIIKFRKEVGPFRTKTDLLKIYGIDSTFFKSVENQIQIEVVEEAPEVINDFFLTEVELNSADTTDLMELKGIGFVFANRIIKYRNLLGGFYVASQLLEVYNFPEETFDNIKNNISVDTFLIKKINLNFAEYADLLRHPYLNKKQVEAILNYRDNNGSFQNILDVKTSGIIDSETFARIRPYFTCR